MSAGPRSRTHRVRAALRAVPLTLLLAVSGDPSDLGAAREPFIGELVGDRTGDEGDALAFGMFIYGFDTPPTVSWDFGDGTNVISGAGLTRISHEYLEGPKTYTVTARIQGAISATRSLRVQIDNAAPVIDFLEVEPDPRLEEPVSIRARATDPGGDAITWTWDFGDGSPPRTGEELGEVSHKYRATGRYRVTLTVSDGDASSSRTVDVFVGPDLVAATKGAMTDTILAASGPANMMAGTMFAASPPPSISVGRTNDYCMVLMGFWDDAHKVHINFLWTPTPERLFQPGVYRVADRSERPTANVVMAQFHYMGMTGSYDGARKQAAQGGAAPSNPASIIGSVLGNLRAMQRGMQGSGDNWPLYGRGGTVRITHASEDQIRGTFRTRVQGPSMRDRKERTIDLEGRFVFRPVSEQTGPALRSCAGERPFTIVAHAPGRNQRAVSYLAPAIEVEFSRKLRPATASGSTVEVGYLDSSMEFQRIESTLSVDSDARTVRVTPNAPLRALVYYRVRIKGGPGGVLGEGGEQLPEDSYEWRFATAPKNVPGARGGR